MGWSSSIHIATIEREKVIQRLKRLGEHKCFVGVSGDGWVGVYSQACERSGGIQTPKLASNLSANSQNDAVVGVCLSEDDFRFWLFREGRLLDQHPTGIIRRLISKSREILTLAKDSRAREKIVLALKSNHRLRPNELAGVSEQEFIEKATRDLARVQTMTAQERDKMLHQYSQFRSRHAEDLNTICEAIGIMEYDWNYSDFAEPPKSDEETRPPASMRAIHVGK
jgi:hypothetical protein